MNPEPIRVLIVEDDTDDFLLLKVMLSGLKNQRFGLNRVSTYEEALKKMAEGGNDVCLLDYRLEGKNGIDFLREARAKGFTIPIILLTGQGDYNTDLEAMRLGASDFLNKNKLDAAMLERSIRYTLCRKKAEDSLRQREEFYREVLENSLDGVAIVDEKGIRYLSPSTERILGYRPEEIIRSGGTDLIHPEDLPRLKAGFNEIFSVPGSVSDQQFRAKHKNGSWRFLEIIAKNSINVRSIEGIVVNYRDITSRKGAERVFSRLAAIVEASNDAIYSMTLEGAIASWNLAAQRIYGYTPEQIGGRHCSLLVPSGRREEFPKLLAEVGAGNAVSNFNTIHHTKNGAEVLLSLALSPIRNEQGQITMAAVVARDITESEKSKALRDMLQAERDQLLERLQLQMERMPIACILSDENFNFTYWNPAAEKMFGYSFREVEGHKGVIVPESDWAEHEKYLRGIGRGEESATDVVRKNVRKDGSTILCEWYRTPMYDSEKRFVGLISMAVDITTRKKIEDVQSQLAAILQQTTDAVIGTDLKGHIFSWNKGAEDMFGYGLEEVLGRPAKILAPPDRQHEVDEIREIALGGENISNMETVRVKKNGDTMDVSITFSPIKDSSGKTIGVSSISRDITERKRAEESLRMHQEQLRQAEKMNAIGRLAGGVAHDFNNLLSVIGGNAEFLLSSLERNNPHREELEEIQKAVQRGADLTKQLLVFGQKQVVQPQSLNLNDMTTDMSKMLKRLIDATIDLAILQDKDLPAVLSDLGQLQQVILNLVLNARDAMPNGGHLILETKRVDADKLEQEGRPTLPPGSYVRLAVTDTGIGMSEEIQSHIFEPFFTTKKGKGTGLGLASVYGIVTKWSGHIFLHSTPGMGTTFTLYFPALADEPGPVKKAKQMNLIPHGSETLLVAEDEEPVRKILVRTLEKYGYRVLEAQNGIEAVQKAWGYREPIHLLLTDAMMPKMNGRELAEELKKTRPKVKVLFVSGYPREVLSEQGILDSSIHLIQKPYEQEQLVREVRRILDEK